jgi:hypothetical protein
MLMHDKYTLFENRLRDEYILSDEKILEIFNKSFILHELRLIANELKRQDIIKRKALSIPVSLHKNEHSELNSSNINIDAGKHISDIVKNSDNVFNINIMLNDKNDNMSTPYIRDDYEQQNNYPDIYEEEQLDYLDNTANIQNAITTSNVALTNNLTNSYSTFNTSNSAFTNTSNTVFTNTSNIGLNNILQNAINNGVNNQYNSQNFLQQLQLSQFPAQSQLSSQEQLLQQQQRLQQQQLHPQLQQLQQQQQLLQPQQRQQTQQQSQQQRQKQQQQKLQTPNRIYNPIDYKQNYRGDMRYRPSVCSYGTKQIVQPIFVNSSTLFQGTDLKEASENTQVGSIMPKFKYYEYEDIK